MTSRVIAAIRTLTRTTKKAPERGAIVRMAGGPSKAGQAKAAKELDALVSSGALSAVKEKRKPARAAAKRTKRNPRRRAPLSEKEIDAIAGAKVQPVHLKRGDRVVVRVPARLGGSLEATIIEAPAGGAEIVDVVRDDDGKIHGVQIVDVLSVNGARRKNPATMTAAEGKRFRAEVVQANERTLRALARAKVKELRAEIKRARKRGPLRMKEVRDLLKRTRALVAAGAKAEGQADVDRAKKELVVEKEGQATQARLERANRAAARLRPVAKAKERRSESDGEVEGNLPADFVYLWRKVKSSIRATDRKSRTEAFLEYAEAHPGEVVDAAPGVDAHVAELEARANRAESFATKKTYSAADYAAVPF